MPYQTCCGSSSSISSSLSTRRDPSCHRRSSSSVMSIFSANTFDASVRENASSLTMDSVREHAVCLFVCLCVCLCPSVQCLFTSQLLQCLLQACCRVDFLLVDMSDLLMAVSGRKVPSYWVLRGCLILSHYCVSLTMSVSWHWTGV